jgi:hypothetical protein
MKIKLYILLTLFSLGHLLKAQNPSFNVGSGTSVDTMLVGDQFVFSIGAIGDVNNLNWPSLKDSIGQFEIIKELGFDTTQQSPLQIQKGFVLTYFDTGYIEIPGVAITKNQDTIYTQKHGVWVLPVMIDTTNNRFYGYTEPIEIPTHIDEILYYVYWGLGILAILGLIFFIIYKINARKKKELKPEILIPAHIIALGHLSDFKQKKLLEKEEIKTYYSELSDILRTYLENRYKFLAMESTTDEIMKELKELVFHSEKKKEISEFLKDADLVKFAKAIPEAHKHESYLTIIESFIHLTKEVEVENGDQ